MENKKIVLKTPIIRNEITSGCTTEQKVSCGTLFVTINWNDNKTLIECFIQSSKTGTCKSNLEGLARMISLAMRFNVPLHEILKQLHGIRCYSCTTTRIKEEEEMRIKNKGELPQDFKNSVYFSCPDTVGKIIAKSHKMIEKKEVSNGKDIQKNV